MTIQSKFWLTNVALVTGILSVVAGVAGSFDLILIGICILLGVLAYRSRKRTRLGLQKDSTVRRVFEVLALFSPILIIFLQNDPLRALYLDPWMAVPPIWSFIAYFAVYDGQPTSPSEPSVAAAITTTQRRLFQTIPAQQIPPTMKDTLAVRSNINTDIDHAIDQLTNRATTIRTIPVNRRTDFQRLWLLGFDNFHSKWNSDDANERLEALKDIPDLIKLVDDRN